MFSFSHLRPRVSLSHEHGVLSVHIARNNDRSTYIVMLVGFTAAFVCLCYIFLPPFFRRPLTTDVLYVLLFIGLFVVWYVISLRFALWRAFGVEEIVVAGGLLRWTRTALFWSRRVEIPTTDISAVKAILPWHSLGNCVEFTASGKQQTIGDMLLRDETTNLAEKLRRAVGIAESVVVKSPFHK